MSRPRWSSARDRAFAAASGPIGTDGAAETAEVDVDVFCDHRFSEPRSGAIGDILILGRMGRTGPPAPPARSTVVRFSPDSQVDFPRTEEAERFLAAIAEVCDGFGITFRWDRQDKPD